MKLGVLPSVFILLTVFLSGCGRKEPLSPNATGAGPSQVQPGSGQGATNQPGGARSIDGLLQGLPKDKQPKPGPEGTIERNEAKGWLAKNVVGKTMEFSLRVEAVEVEPSGEGKYNVELQLLPNADRGEAKKLHSNVIIGSLMLGATPCQVQVWGPEPLWPDLDAATAKKRRDDLKGKQVFLSAKVTEAEFLEGEDEKQLLLMIGLADVKLLRAEEPSWVAIKEGPCTVLFPQKPERTRHDFGPEKPKFTQYLLKLNGVEYVAGISDQGTPEMIREANKLGDAAARLKAQRDWLTNFHKTQVSSERSLRLGKHTGMEWTLLPDKDGLTYRFQSYVTDDRTVTLSVSSTTPDDVTNADADRFFKSLMFK